MSIRTRCEENNFAYYLSFVVLVEINFDFVFQFQNDRKPITFPLSIAIDNFVDEKWKTNCTRVIPKRINFKCVIWKINHYSLSVS